ncbi:hypothetical protein DOZ58_09840 [Acetobacterium sp. KB-1]|nr:hypothetical protein DOZ58_09840 [Acetobacterium sp. KB-1]
MEIIHARHKKVSTIFCSQFAPLGWYSKFPEATVADAILDRIIHNSHSIEIQYIDKEHDRSMREIYGIVSISVETSNRTDYFTLRVPPVHANDTGST